MTRALPATRPQCVAFAGRGALIAVLLAAFPGGAAAIDQSLDCGTIGKRIASQNSLIEDLEPTHHSYNLGPVHGREDRTERRQGDILKQRQAQRRIAALQDLSRRKGCPQ